MDRFFGLIGFVVIFFLAFLMSKNRKAIDYRLVVTGILIQVLLAIFILKVPIGQTIFAYLGHIITRLLDFSQKGAEFVFGVFVNKATMAQVFGPNNAVIFVFMLLPTVILVCVLVSIAYHIGLMQRIVLVLAKAMNKIMRVSGSESLSNVSSAFVGQVEAQIMIQPYLSSMTRSELLASITGSMACIAGGVMAVYIAMGVPAEYLLASSLMAAPAALVISKIVLPETEQSKTKGKVQLEIKKTHVNVLDAISHGAGDGMKVSLNVIAMLIGFIALIYVVDAGLIYFGHKLVHLGTTALMSDGILRLPEHLIGKGLYELISCLSIDPSNLTLKSIMGAFFSMFAYIMGVPLHETNAVGSLMGTKFAINEFVAYADLSQIKDTLSPKAMVIASFALCGFANFSSIAIQVGGIGQLAPDRRSDLARLGFLALICGTLTNYLSATLAGILL